MGWVRLHRKLADHPIWTREKFTKGQAWVDLILLASYADHIAFQSTKAVTVKRGQVLTSQVNLAKRWRWNRETVRTFLLLLKSTNMVAIETSKATDTGYTLITMLSYELYQGERLEPKIVPSAIDSAIETSIDPASNQHPTATINKGKKGKKEKEPPPSVFNEQTFWEKFPAHDQEIIHQTIEAIHSTRKRGRVADSVIQGELRWWDQVDPAQVIQGMRTYLQKGYAAQGKREEYLRGIIRNSDGQTPQSAPSREANKSPGNLAIQRAAMSMTVEDCSSE